MLRGKHLGRELGPLSRPDFLSYGRADFGLYGECEVLSVAAESGGTSIQCRTAPGVGGGLRWVATVRGRRSTLDDAPVVSYRRPAVASIAVEASRTDRPKANWTLAVRLDRKA